MAKRMSIPISEEATAEDYHDLSSKISALDGCHKRARKLNMLAKRLEKKEEKLHESIIKYLHVSLDEGTSPINVILYSISQLRSPFVEGNPYLHLEYSGVIMSALERAGQYEKASKLAERIGFEDEQERLLELHKRQKKETARLNGDLEQLVEYMR